MYITAFLKQEEIMRTLICILFILISGIISLLFSIKYAFLKKFSTQEKQIQYAYKSLQRLTKVCFLRRYPIKCKRERKYSKKSNTFVYL